MSVYVELIMSENEIRQAYPKGRVFDYEGRQLRSTGEVLPPLPAVSFASFPRLVAEQVMPDKL